MSVLALLVPAMLVTTQAPAAVHSAPPTATTLPTALPNDNRTTAGTLRDGVLTLRLVVQWSAWTLNSRTARDLPMLAFAEEGKAPTIPGPFARPVRTRVRFRANPIRNCAGHRGLTLRQRCARFSRGSIRRDGETEFIAKPGILLLAISGASASARFGRQPVERRVRRRWAGGAAAVFLICSS
jgi:hypothetical protein